MMAKFSLYKCHTSYCRTTYAVQTGVVDEPTCPVCGCYYFTHIQDVEIELKEVDVNVEVQVEQEGLTQSSCHNELCSA